MLPLVLQPRMLGRDDEGGDDHQDGTEGLQRGSEGTVVWPAAVKEVRARDSDCCASDEPSDASLDSRIVLRVGFVLSNELFAEW